MQIHSVGIDLGKTTFHLVALGAAGRVLVKKKFTQRQLLTFPLRFIRPGDQLEMTRHAGSTSRHCLSLSLRQGLAESAVQLRREFFHRCIFPDNFTSLSTVQGYLCGD